MKSVIQRSLPLDCKYTLEFISHIPIEEGGCTCENCGRLIANIAHIKSEKGCYCIGLDCLDTILENNKLLDQDSYVQYIFSDKPAIQKAKALRAKILKNQKKDENFKAIFKQLDNTFGFSFESKNSNGSWKPLGWDYTFQNQYRKLTLSYIKGIDCVVIK